MRKTIPLALLCAIALFACATVDRTALQTPPGRSSGGVLGEGADWETEYQIVDSGKAGPTVMIVGGVHGNEPAGARAADQIRNWKIDRGKLIVIPRANVRALREETRFTPSVTTATRNLNRNFPISPGEPVRGPLAQALWDLVCETRPDYLLDLHEGYSFSRTSKSVGNSIIVSSSEEARNEARRMLDAINATIEEQDQRFTFKGPPVKGSLARAAFERMQIPSMILETTYLEQPLSHRARQHRIMVGKFLADLGMFSGDVDSLIDGNRQREGVRVALYDAGGSLKSPGPAALEKILTGAPGVAVRRIGPPEIRRGVLEQFDVVIFAGGSGSKQSRALGEEGVEAVRDYVRAGGGYIGLCAGAYLATSDYAWSLKILDARTVDRKHWKRGTGIVKIEMTDEGRRILGGNGRLLDIKYANGPLLAPTARPEIPDFETLAHFRSEIAKNGAPKGVMIDTPAMTAGRFGKGRVFCSSPHPEYTPGLEEFVRRAVHWTAGQ